MIFEPTARSTAAFSALMPSPWLPFAPGMRMTAGVTLVSNFAICGASAAA